MGISPIVLGDELFYNDILPKFFWRILFCTPDKFLNQNRYLENLIVDPKPIWCSAMLCIGSVCRRIFIWFIMVSDINKLSDFNQLHFHLSPFFSFWLGQPSWHALENSEFSFFHLWPTLFCTVDKLLALYRFSTFEKHLFYTKAIDLWYFMIILFWK